jgi:predicted O-linked N-acetylglucosamine transferase (SPINDLY family)
MAESLFKAGNFHAAHKLLMDIPTAGAERDFLLGQCCARLGNKAGATLAYSNVLSREPGHSAAASALGLIYISNGWLDKAEAVYTRALKKKDDDKLRTEMAVLLWSRNRRVQALEEFGRVISRSPRFFPARLQRANALLTLGRLAEAAEDLYFLRREDPENPQYLGSLGNLELRQGNYPEAAELLQKAWQHQPSSGPLLQSLAIAQILVGRLVESRQSLQRLRQVDPPLWQEMMASTELSRVQGDQPDSDFDPRPAFLLLTFQQQLQADWTNLPAFHTVFHELIANPQNSDLGALAHASGIARLDTGERLRMMQHAARAAAAGCTPWQHAPSPAPARLRIGYILPHLGIHVVAQIMRDVIAAHDPDSTEILVFSTRQEPRDYASGRAESYQQAGARCIDLTPLDDQAAAERVHREQLDVLVDLAVYNDHARPGIVARRPAPVQVNFLGGPFTSGGTWMDYIITDARVSPGQPGWCTEAEVQVPSSYFVFGHEGATPPPAPSRSDFKLPEDRFLFSGLNGPYKIDPETFDAWMQILAATPRSLLLLKGGSALEANLRREAEQRGTDPARLLFLPNLESDRDFLLRQGTPDLFLDTRYYGGHTTMAESLWMGVPALTCPGESFQSRVGSSLLASCDLHELIVPDWDSYVATAIALYNDRPRLLALKEKLAQTRLTAAPFDMQGQARTLEKAFRHMRERFAQGLPPEPFRVADIAG